uniref:Cilia- and flagella-associated protein 157 n=1 Tax=Haemonchus contortus TaxID=6289 RepID=A0A7I5E7H8_HAECO
MASDVAFYAERLAHKEHELTEFQAAFNKYKLKTKVKFDQLRKEVNAYCTEHGFSLNEKENNALLLIRLAENETAMEAANREAEVLRKELSRKQTQLNDQQILIKNMEEQLRTLQPLSSVEIQERKRAAQMLDMDRIHQQMLFKDERIVELNNVILDKERQILDLQELCREQGEVASVTSQAARIVQRQWEDKNRERREVGTETDASLWSAVRPAQESRARSDSPGRAVPSRGTANTSPPPLDPSEALERSNRRDDDEDLPNTSNSLLGKSLEWDSSLRKKNRKRVTFDLISTFQQPLQPIKSPSGEQVNALLELTEDNERLRRELLEANTNLGQLQTRLNEVDAEMTRVVRDSKTQSLKARAVAQGRIKELEDRMAELKENHAEQVERLQTEIESLRSTREWEVEQNAQLREQLNETKTKNHKLTEELDASEKANRDWEVKVSQGEEFLDQLIEDLAEAEDIINYMEQQKHSILDDVDKLKDAIIAQDQLIEILEADIVIYEEHIGILRESLGASKIDHRSLLRSKAFETKLRALEKEKEQIDRRSNEDRLRTKALDQKCKVLEEENEKLMAKLCEFEMRERDEADMSETCRQLERKIAEAEEKAAVNRAESDLRVEAARLEAERKSNEVARLLDELHAAQEELSRRRSSSFESRGDHGLSGNNPPGQTYPNAEVEQLRSRAIEQDAEIARLRSETAQLNALREEMELVKKKSAEVAEELDAIRCTNFELMTKTDTLTLNLKKTEEEKEGLREMYEKICKTLEEKENEETAREEKSAAIEEDLRKTRSELEVAQRITQELEEELAAARVQLTDNEANMASQRVDFGETQERINRLEEELFAARSELDNARFGLQETTAVKKELEHLKEELELERSSGRAKWEEVCKKVLEGESNSSESRKNSLEVINKVQHLEYITAFEEKITCLEKELQEARVKMEQDKAEKKKLKAALKQIRDREKCQSELTDVQQQSVTEMRQNAVLLESLQTAPQPLSAAELQQPPEVDVDHLRLALKEMELENRLSRELNTEYSHTMLEMEKEVIGLKAQITSLRGESEHFEMELKLHEMLEEELERELADVRSKNRELTEAMQSHEESQERFSERMSCDAVKNNERLNELISEVRELRERNAMLQQQLNVATDKIAEEENLLAEEREHFSEIDKAHCEEVRELSITLADARRTISDMEVRLAEAEGNFAQSQTLIADLTSALDKKSLEFTQLNRELSRVREADVVQTGLLRAPNTTSEAVASVLVGETEAVRPDANQGLVVKPADNRTGSETSSTEEPSSAEANSDVEANALPTGNDLFAENLILRQCIHETSQMQNDLSQDVERMWQLKTELENAVEVLKGEIWSLNSQLKASILDREQLQDRVVQLDTSLEAEKKRADALDCELSEQTELTEKATRQAAEAENESNRRLAECLEMETRREQVEKAYAQLSEYYSQLQSAYNVIYAKLKQIETEKTLAESEQQAASSSTQDKNVEHVVNTMISELHLNVDDGLSLHGKVLLIQKVLREKLVELEQHHLAIAEHRRTNEVLNEQLKCLEEQSQKAGCETVDMMTRLKQLEGELEWKKDECNSLHRRAEELQAAIDQLVERNTEADAAKLATRQADVDALFRANAELVHTNVRLQNELDENEERATTSDQDVKIRDLQAELSASRNNEESLRRQLEEVRSILNETEQKLEEFASEKERSSRQADVLLQAREQPEPLSRPAECLSAATSLEESLKESVGLQEEVERLHAVEKLLNERIMCLEDQLLEVEEKLQETEEEFISERQKVEALEAEKQPSSREVEQADVSIQSDNDDGSQLCTACKAREQQAEKSNEDEWGLEASSSTAEHVRSVGELSRVKEELEKIRKQLTEQKLNPAERSAVVKEFQALQQLLREKDELFAAGDKPEQQWGWDDAQSEVTVDTSALRDRLSEMESIERQQQETIRAQETRIRALEEELSTADACREELEDATEQVNTLQKELREMKKQAQVYSEEQQRLVNRISELEAKTENAWGDEWDNADGGADEGKEELEQSKFEAHQRIAELELQIEQKVCALVDAEKELAMLRERLQAVGPERSDLQKNPDLPTSDEQSSRNMEKVLEEERHRREEAEALAENLRQVAATLRSQVDDLQEKLLNGMESAEKQLIQLNELSSENERLRKTIASRTELVEAEHQRSESELETLCEERRRIQNELSSAENEKIRLEEQLMACEMKCDDLKIELQLQKANNTELTGLHEEAKKRCEDAQIALKAVEAENSALLERLRKAEGELNELQRQLQETLSHCQQKGPSSDDGVHGNASQWERLEKILSEVRRELEEKELQNSLLKDSEARLLDSVDEYGLQAENYQKEAERLQNVVNQLERERLELEEEVEKMRRSNDRLGEAENKVKMMERERKELEERLRQQSTSTASSSNHDTEEMSKLSNQLNMLTAERNELRTRLQDAESRLQVSAQEKVAITRSYEQLRARLAARRQKLTSSGETRSRPPSAAISEEDVSQSSRRVEESVPPSPNAYVSQQEASIGHHNYREAISVFIDDVERFLDEQDEIFDGLTAAIGEQPSLKKYRSQLSSSSSELLLA